MFNKEELKTIRPLIADEINRISAYTLHETDTVLRIKKDTLEDILRKVDEATQAPPSAEKPTGESYTPEKLKELTERLSQVAEGFSKLIAETPL